MGAAWRELLEIKEYLDRWKPEEARILLYPSKGVWCCQLLASGLLAFRTVREYIPVVCGNLFQQP